MSSEQFEVFVPKEMLCRTSYDSTTGERITEPTDPYPIDVEEAFRLAVTTAAYEFGHSGYTGSIAEKEYFTMLEDEPVLPDRVSELIDSYLVSPGPDSKWGPAMCIEVVPLGDNPDEKAGWWFFGYASS